jgi:hypothetical protein
LFGYEYGRAVVLVSQVVLNTTEESGLHVREGEEEEKRKEVEGRGREQESDRSVSVDMGEIRSAHGGEVERRLNRQVCSGRLVI